MATNKTFGAGIDTDNQSINNRKIIQYINLKLAALGYPYYKEDEKTTQFLEFASPLLDNFREKSRILSEHLSPVAQRIQNFIDAYLSDVPGYTSIPLPQHTLVLDMHGIARNMSLPPNADIYETDIVKTYRTAQGIIHNPKADKRTTQGVFHVCEGGLPIADDKKAVPKLTFARLLEAAFNPPRELMRLPYTANQHDKAELFVSLLLRPVVVPEVPGITREKTMEVRFFAPGNLIGNLDFVESIFGNAGDPHLPENDAALDADGWTGHTGCVILATHLVGLKKKDLGLPHYDQATERQRRDGMCWKNEDEKYNEGTPFKITARDKRGVVITVIADNYFGYCKKEVKTQISFSSNLYGLCEEEHAGGALAFPGYDLGERFSGLDSSVAPGLTFAELLQLYGAFIEQRPEGHGRDKRFQNILYVPENSNFNLFEQSVTWEKSDGSSGKIKLLPQNHYILPSGYKVQMKKRLNGRHWHLVGTVAEGTFCHKPCTVSGGGKSEISKSIQDAMIQGPVYIADLQHDLNVVEEIINKDFSTRFKIPIEYQVPPRGILDSKRSLGSVIKLLTPADEYTDEYNEWLSSITQGIKDLIYIVKRRYHSEWDADWKTLFSVDVINGIPGSELKFQGRKLISNYLRVGHALDKSWRLFKVRQDFYPAQKIQTEDDISASIVVPRNRLSFLNDVYDNAAVKLLTNCESRLFQRPDDCVVKGYDKQAEFDIASPNTFLSNFEPLRRDAVKEIREDSIGFDHYTQPVKNLIENFLAAEKPEYLVVPSEPRLVDGVPSANPRYLQVRPDLVQPIHRYIAETCTRLFRQIPMDKPLFMPVNMVLPGRRNNPAEPANKVPPLAVYNPIHYQELPELFIDYICSITGKSPSTTGFGSEGALTKGPFNNLLPAADLNNALLSYILTGYNAFTTAAGYVGPKYKVDHDVSLLVPEVVSRMSVEERDPKYMIEHDYLEPISDFIYEGEKVEASLLGYRITHKFVTHFLGRIFSNPDVIFNDEMLHPELQDMETFVSTLKNLSTTQKRVAAAYMLDGTYEELCPPLQALVGIMNQGHYQGMDRHHPEFRKLFCRDCVLESDWYRQRLETKQQRDIQFWADNVRYLEEVITRKSYSEAVVRLNLAQKLEESKANLSKVQSAEYIQSLYGTLGADPLQPIK